ncbi:MAG: hypothetical protein IJ519_03460 [Clostridia bacterium]|nr:hypothetical protein [Clostridia bacterium]
MGFGILFFGYMMLFSVPYKGIDFPPLILAYLLILIALTKMGKYIRKVRFASYFSGALLALSAVKLSYQIAVLFTAIPETVMNVITVTEIVLTLPFYFFMLIGFAELAEQVELPKLAGKCKRNFGIVCLFYAFTIFFTLYNYGVIPYINGVSVGGAMAIQQVLGYIMRFMNLFLIASCYRLICLEGDEDMPYTPNKFEAFMTKLVKGDRKDK